MCGGGLAPSVGCWWRMAWRGSGQGIGLAVQVIIQGRVGGAQCVRTGLGRFVFRPCPCARVRTGQRLGFVGRCVVCLGARGGAAGLCVLRGAGSAARGCVASTRVDGSAAGTDIELCMQFFRTPYHYQGLLM